MKQLESVMKRVCRHFGVQPWQILAQNRHRREVDIRFTAIGICVENCGDAATHEAMSQVFKRDREAIEHAYIQFRNRIANDLDFAGMVSGCRRAINLEPITGSIVGQRTQRKKKTMQSSSSSSSRKSASDEQNNRKKAPGFKPAPQGSSSSSSKGVK